MALVGFADESGTSGSSRCYAIGVLSVAAEKVEEFNSWFWSQKNRHGVQGEFKWTRIRRSHGAINLAIDALDAILRSESATFDAIVVNKQQYRNWQGGTAQRERAFYQSYTQLLRHVVRRAEQTSRVLIDNRSDSYPRHHEVVLTVGNRMLAQLESSGRLDGVDRADSRSVPGIQVTDVLTGAINAAHLRQLDAASVMNAAKELTVRRLASMLGWDDLCYDTFPHTKFNIWHFPIEYRAMPRTRNPQPSGLRPYVWPEDIW